MSVPTPTIRSLSSKVPPEVRGAFSDIQKWLAAISKEGGVSTERSFANQLADAVGAIVPSGLLDLTIPPRPENVQVTGAFNSIMITWDTPGYRSHSYAEVWRNTVDDLGTAVMVGTTSAPMYADNPPDSRLSVVYYYWVRFVSKSGVKGPFHDNNGATGSTADEPGYLLDVLAGELQESELHHALNARIDLIDTPVTGILDKIDAMDITWGGGLLEQADALATEQVVRAQEITQEATTRAAEIAAEAQLRVDGDLAEALARAAAINAESAARAQGFVDEAAARTTAIQAEASARAQALLDEATARNAAIAVETQNRITAITTEQNARAQALLNEAAARDAAILVETTARQSADSALASQITTVSASVDTNTAAIQAEATARANGDLAEAQARELLASTVSGHTAAISSEVTARTSADLALANSITTLTGTVNSNTAAIQAEASARADAISAEAAARQTLAALVDTNTAAITTEAQARSTVDESLAGQIIELAATVLNTSASIAYEAEARATETTALSRSISLLTAGVSGGFDAGDVWYFDADVEGWTGSNATVAFNNGWITVDGTGSSPAVSKTGLSLSGAKYALVKVRIKRVAGTGWTGKLQYSTAGHGFSDSYQYTLAEPNYDSNDTAVIDFLMDQLTMGGNDWIAGTITGLNLILGAGADDTFEVDYIAVGRSAPGASVAALETEQQARADAISAEAAQRTTLATQVRGSYTGSDASQLTTGLIYSERQSRITALNAEISAREALAATVSGNHTTAMGAITSEQNLRISADNALASDISSLEARVYDNEAAITAEASARATADSAEVTAREALATQVRGGYAGTDPAMLTTGLLYNERQARITADSAEVSAREALAATVSSNHSTAMGAINTEATTRANADNAISTTVSTLSSRVDGHDDDLATVAADIISEASTRASADTAEANARLALAAQIENDISAAVLAESNARASADGALAEDISALVAELDTPTTGVKARLSTVETATVTLDGALSTRLDALQASYEQADHTAGEAILSAAVGAENVRKVSTAYLIQEQQARANSEEAFAGQLTVMQAEINGNAAAIVTEATTRATALEAEAAAREVLRATLEDYADAAVLTESTARASADEVLAESITALTSTLDDPVTGLAAAHAAVVSEQYARIVADSAEATARNALSAQVNHPATGLAAAHAAVVSESQARATADEAEASARESLAAAILGADGTTHTAGAIYNERLVRLDAEEAIAGDVSILSAQVNNATTGLPATRALLLQEYYTKAGTDSAITSATSTLSSTVAGHTSTLETHGSSINGLEAKYTVKIDNNGYVTGYGLASTANNGTPTSEFMVVADKFSIAPVATNPTADDGSPFYHLTSSQVVDGVTVPAGTYMKTAYIADATITTAKIKSLSADKLVVPGTASIWDAIITNGKITNAYIGDFIQSNNYVAGSAGWKINKDGNAEFANVKVRGDVEASSLSGIVELDADKITAGSLNINWIGGNVRSGKTSYSDSAAGWWLGNDSGTPKFSIGGATNYLRWTGSVLELGGDIIATGNIKAGAVTSESVFTNPDTVNVALNAWTTAGTVVLTVAAGEKVDISCSFSATKGNQIAGISLRVSLSTSPYAAPSSETKVYGSSAIGSASNSLYAFPLETANVWGGNSFVFRHAPGAGTFYYRFQCGSHGTGTQVREIHMRASITKR